MASNKNLAVADFDSIKAGLKDFLKGNPAFSDYNFEGSALSTLIGLLSYNTHHNAMYTNLALNEMFLDSAVTRGGVISRSRELGYVPRSASASEALINVFVTGVSEAEQSQTLTINRGTRFTGIGETSSISFGFVVVEPVTVSISNNAFTFASLPIKEGELFSYRFDVNVADGGTKIFELPHNNIDTSTLRVRVQTSQTDLTIRSVTYGKNIYDLNSESSVYFLQENFQGKFEIIFGDGVLGKAIETGNIILVDYLVTNKGAANGIQRFMSRDPVGIFSPGRLTISTVSPAVGGAEKESISNIKALAPMVRSAQNRAVTANDLRAKLLNEVALFESVSVWGGEDNVPPIYGKVFISVKPAGGLFLSNALKQHIIDTIIKPVTVVSITPEFVDPDYVWVSLSINSKFNPNKTSLSAVNLGNAIKYLTMNFFATEVEKFNQSFNLSELIKTVHNFDLSISSVLVDISMCKRFWFIPYFNQAFLMNFNNGISPYSIRSQPFQRTTNGITKIVYMVDVPDLSGNQAFSSISGKIQLQEINSNAVVETNFGTVDYVNGWINIPQITIDALYNDTGQDFKISAKPRFDEIHTYRNQLLVLDTLVPGSIAGAQTGLLSFAIEDYTQ